jgi:hypothetical protein
MTRARTPGRVGLLWMIIALVTLLTLSELARGRDSRLRSWWGALRLTPAESIEQLIGKFRRNPETLRPRP